MTRDRHKTAAPRRGTGVAAWMRVALSLIAGLSQALAQQTNPSLNPAADPNHKLTAAEFFKDVAGNFRALISTQSIVPLLAGGAAYGLATVPEQGLEKHFAPGDVWGAWPAPGRYIGHPLLLGGIGFASFAVSRKSQDRRFRSLSYALVQGSIMSTALVQPTKLAFRRLRPNGEDRQSFPSGHASDSFMFATVFAVHYGWKAAVPGYAIASYVAATRLADRKHHLTDVVAGAGIGYLVGRTVSRGRPKGDPSRVSASVFPAEGGFRCLLQVRLD
jgi:hypothetical protein